MYTQNAQRQQADMSAAKGGNQTGAWQTGRSASTLCGAKRLDKPCPGETADKEAHHRAGQVVGGETGRHSVILTA